MMTDHFSTLYQDVFLQTQGYLPAWPALPEVTLGDLLVSRPVGGLVKLGNVLDPFFGININAEINTSTKNEWWNLQRGVEQSYATTHAAENGSGTNGASLNLKFAQLGDYIFSAQVAQQASIGNFWNLQFKLLQVLAAEKFSFKEVYVVTSVATAKACSLLLAKQQQASAVVGIPDGETGVYDFSNLLDKDCTATIQAQERVDLRYFNYAEELSFFRAMKLEASPSGKEKVRAYAKNNLPLSMQDYMEEIIHFAPTQILPSINIYPAEVHELFHFRSLNLLDVKSF